MYVYTYICIYIVNQEALELTSSLLLYHHLIVGTAQGSKPQSYISAGGRSIVLRRAPGSEPKGHRGPIVSAQRKVTQQDSIL